MPNIKVAPSEPSPSEVLPPAEESPAVVPPSDMDETEELLTKHIRCTDTGVIVEGDLPLEKWAKGFEFFQKIGSKTQWWRGDMLVYGERKYGESYAQAVDLHGKSESRLQTYVYVALKFPIERRRPELSFDHHAECASLEAREADALLLRAIRERWTKMDVREETARINERNGVPKRGRKPGSTAAKVAASGKTPQVPEGEKPLTWNGYPLRVMALVTGGRVILQGDEPLTSEESDHAAHFHKFNHKEGLMNWLEEHNFIKPEGGEPCASTTKSSEHQSALAAVENTAAIQTAPSKSIEASNGAAPNATESAPTPQELDPLGALWNQDAPEGQCWKCPDCGVWASLGGNAAFHVTKSGHGMPTLIQMPVIEPAAPPAAPEPLKATETPLQACERLISAFNEASKAVDWAEVGRNALRRQRWLSQLLIVADQTIDTIQNNPPAPRK